MLLYQGVFVKLQLPTDNCPNDQRRKSLENVNACVIVTFSWLFHKTITFQLLSLIKERITLKIAFWWTFQQLNSHNIATQIQLMLTKPRVYKVQLMLTKPRVYKVQLMLTKPRVYTVQLAAHQVHMLWLKYLTCCGRVSHVLLWDHCRQ